MSVSSFVTVCFNYFKEICLHINTRKSFGVHRRLSLQKMIPITDLNIALCETILNDPLCFSFYFRFLYLSLSPSLFQVEKTLKDQRDPGEAIFDTDL